MNRNSSAVTLLDALDDFDEEGVGEAEAGRRKEEEELGSGERRREVDVISNAALRCVFRSHVFPFAPRPSQTTSSFLVCLADNSLPNPPPLSNKKPFSISASIFLLSHFSTDLARYRFSDYIFGSETGSQIESTRETTQKSTDKTEGKKEKRIGLFRKE